MIERPLHSPEAQAFLALVLELAQRELAKNAPEMHPVIVVRRTSGATRQFVIARDSLGSALIAACATSRTGELYALVAQTYIWTRPTSAPARMAEMDDATRERLGIVEGVTVTLWEADGTGQRPQRPDTRVLQAAIEAGPTLGQLFEMDVRDVPRPIDAPPRDAETLH